MIDYPNELDIIFEKLDKLSIKPIIVGGYIRDKFLNIDSKDIDIELYGLKSFEELEYILQEFGSFSNVGKSFGVCKLSFKNLDLDFSLPREDSKISSGHKGIKAVVYKNLDFKTASSRRDFTINAMGFDVKEKKILDPFNGKKDLEDKILKAVDSNTFAQDPLRVLRALQFSARFELKVDTKLLILCQTMFQKKLLQELPKERIFQEIKKLLLQSKKPSYGFTLLKKIDGFLFFQELAHLSDKLYQRSLKALDRYKPYSNIDEKTKISSMLALLTYYLTKNDTLSFLDKLTNQKNILKKSLLFIDYAKKIDIKNLDTLQLSLLAQDINLKEFFYFLEALHFEKESIFFQNLILKAKKLHIYEKSLPPLIKGKDLIQEGLKPSKEFSIILKQAYKIQLQKQYKTKKEILDYLKRENFF